MPRSSTASVPKDFNTPPASDTLEIASPDTITDGTRNSVMATRSDLNRDSSISCYEQLSVTGPSISEEPSLSLKIKIHAMRSQHGFLVTMTATTMLQNPSPHQIYAFREQLQWSTDTDESVVRLTFFRRRRCVGQWEYRPGSGSLYCQATPTTNAVTSLQTQNLEGGTEENPRDQAPADFSKIEARDGRPHDQGRAAPTTPAIKGPGRRAHRCLR